MKGGTFGLMVALLSRRPASVRYLATRYGLSQQEVERLLRRLKAEPEGEARLYVSGYAWRKSAYGGRYAVALYRIDQAHNVSLTQWQDEQKQLEAIPALAAVAKRVKSGGFVSTPWDGLLLGGC